MKHAMGWSAAIALAAVVPLTACGGGSTKCDEAVDKLVSDCELGAGADLGGGLSECKDRVECYAECVNEADCDDITDDADNKYHRCRAECDLENYD